MKEVNVNGVRYYIQDKEDMISLVHQLARQGYTNQQIASFLGMTERQVKKYLSDCW